MRFLAVIVCLILADTPEARGVENKFGLGVILGEPLGPNAKYFFDKRSALDVGATYSFTNYFLFYGDYLYHFPNVIRGEAPELSNLTPYIGIGGGARISSESEPEPGDSKAYAFARFPAGIETIFNDPKIGLGLEFALGMALVPDIFLLVQGGLLARYYF